MKFDIGIADSIKLASYGVNGLILSLWLYAKVVVHKFLVGRWEGTLSPTDQPDTIYDCRLLLVGHKDRDNSGFLYYQHKDLRNGQILISGLDELDNYDHEKTFITNRIWSPKFVRAIHKCHGANPAEPPPDKQLPVCYQWECKITALFFRPKMRVHIKGPSRTFCGMLRKH